MARTQVFAVVCALTLPPAAGAGQLSAPLDPALAARLESAFAREMDRYEIPGGAFVVVADGRIVHLAAHGLADLETGRPVDAERTLFYLASVTKTFTATAVMQLVERGELDLHRNVATYLREVRVPETFERPITLDDLLTHTAGLDDQNVGYVARTPEEALPLGRYLAAELPPRVRPPGEAISYSNHGYGLAGRLVELASGRRFEDYLEARVLSPLGMEHSTAHLPPPPSLAPDLATGYRWDARSGAMVPEPYGARNLPPAGTVSATAADMGRFLLAHLGAGPPLLSAGTLERMHARQFAQHPALPGFAYGLYEHPYRGHRVLEHAGGYIGAGTLLVLVPEAGVGLFAATNQATFAPHRAVREILLDHLFPAEQGDAAATVAPPLGSARRASEISGTYRDTRYGRTTVERIALLDGQVRVAPAGPGRIAVANRYGHATEWLEVAPYLFRRSDGDDLVAFGPGEDGGPVRYMFGSFDAGAPGARERVPWYDQTRWQVPFLVASLAVFASVLTLWPASALGARLIRRWRKRPARAPALSRRAVATAAGCALLVLVFVLSVDATLGNSAYRLRLLYGMPPALVAVLWLPVVIAALSVPLGVSCVTSWRARRGSLPTRIYYTLVTAAAVALVAFTIHWHLFGYLG